ncbi:MAG: TatD family hydrolase [Eubacteriales bacterium]
MKLFDTHAHYDDSKFDVLDRDQLLTDLFSGNICAITGASVNLTTASAQLAFADRFPGFYAAVGIHPENLYDDGDMDTVLPRIEEMLSHPKVVAIGEIGLDYYWEQNPPREVQKEWFRAQMELAARTGYPVIIHDREAHGDVFDILRTYPTVCGILHSCSASAEMVKELIKRGWYLSFSGVITYKNATKIAEVVKIVPDDRILVETDCPYLSPVPMRGKVNRSDYVEYTLRRAAEIRGVDPEELARQTVENAKRIYRIDGDGNPIKNKIK